MACQLALSKLKVEAIFMDTLEKLNALSNETDEEFFNHFQSHFSHEQIIEKLNELLANNFPDDLDNYFKGRFSTPKKMYSLVKKIYHFAPKRINQPFYISQYYWANLLNLKQQTLSDYIARLKNLGILICLDDKSTFETEKTAERYQYNFNFQGYCKYYLCNKDRCKVLLDYCYNKLENNDKLLESNNKQGIINTENLPKQFDYNKKYFGMNRIDLINAINELNQDLPDYEKMTLSNEKEYSRIYCPFCNLPTIEHFSKKRIELENQYHDTFTREDYLSGFNTEFQHWDRKASVPFITRLVNYGIITPNDYDLYKDLNGEEFNSPEERNAYKNFFMRLYFCKSKKQCISQAIYSWNQWFYGVQNGKGYKAPILYKWLKETGDVKIDDAYRNNLRNAKFMFQLCIKPAYEKNKNISHEEQEQLIRQYVEKKYDLIEKVLGKRLGKEVFMYESALYLQVRIIAKKENVSMKQCYDSFYFPKDLDFNVMEKITNIIENLNRN